MHGDSVICELAGAAEDAVVEPFRVGSPEGEDSGVIHSNFLISTAAGFLIRPISSMGFKTTS